MMSLVNRLLRKLGWKTCESCGKFIKPKWVKDVVLFEDEPPLFCHWACPKCGATTPIEPTWLTLKALAHHGKSLADIVNKTEETV